MKISKLSIAAFTVIALASSAQATLKSDKVTLKGNMVVEYTKLPAPVNTIKEAFTEGMFYGRLRANAFYWDWDKDPAAGKDNRNLGVGASLIYKSAPLNGLSGTVGLYTSQNPFFRMDKEDVGSSKAGKDTFSRRDVLTGGHYGMTVLGQAYLQYDAAKTSIKVGRQMLETVFTKSNDTKMIPNTFDGVTATIKDIPDTTIQLAYFTAQKLRDHTSGHDVIAFGGGSTSEQKWSQNDDSAVNKSLDVAKVGIDNTLQIASVTNKSIKNLKANISYARVPDVISNLTLEAHYTIPVSGDWKIAPGIRYMNQMDDLDSTTAVANLGKKTDNYTDPNSLDSSLLALRLDVKNKAFLGRIGYSKIADEADIVAPWRGFPTGGFTRAMAQYNWYANTKTYMLRLGYDFGKADMIPGFSLMARYAVQDFDETKPGVAADSNIIHIDARQNIGKDLELKVRLGFVDADVKAGKDTSYNEYRVELNYFF
ncbi:outer membrane porin, OprD family [Candidatus Sulfurimonas marisnigri]|uniref:Outer membrane porin, OprD family n=1 Tax=Candidatus Sulfurimonas marisnigri TaxID=2740405 RepID=A0A7S7RQN6_9BACT|nr:OprD family outer membrane porin [Candidatus Sulfurimonas marisnigri]QOY54866.1 outer membrane porin, OprD family [Candidatus Sulfurimonas marisnigri]